jgi:hypothetical protein
MNKIGVVLMTAMLAACSRAAPTNTVDSLVAHPNRLHEVEQQCANDYAKMGVAECIAASEARHRLFMGNGPKYTPPKEAPKF